MNSAPTKPVVVRVPPSPTGNLHMGTARTALFNYLFAKRHGGRVILRMEDTDKERSKKEFEENIIDGLHWLGLSFDNKTPIRQSERTALYQSALGKLIAAGAAYVSKEEPKEPGGRTEVIRFKNPNQRITFTDLIRGDISFDTTELGDFVIAKSMEEPLYHLAVVVDDLDAGVTHVIRGEDHISNTPRQILLIQALGGTLPQYAHIPLILAPDRSKMSKRHGATSLGSYRDEGYLPEAMVNFLALLGWNPGGDRELYSLAELTDIFDISRIQKGGAVFNVEKLKWFNREYIKGLSPEEKAARIGAAIGEAAIIPPSDVLIRAVDVITERIATFGDVARAAAGGEYAYLSQSPTIDRGKMLFRGEGDFSMVTRHCASAIEIIRALSAYPSNEEVKAALMPYAEREGRGTVLWPVRYALTGLERSPDPFTVVSLIGSAEAIRRLEHAVTLASNS